MTIGDYISNIVLGLGSVAIALTLLYAMWFIVIYVFLGGSDQERSHAKQKLLFASITMMFIMIAWGGLSALGRMLGM